MMALARRKLDGVAWAKLALPGRLPIADGRVGLIVMGLVAEHLADLRPVASEAARASRPGARLVLSALHPDRTAEGQRARFIDPQTGIRRPIATVHRSKDDYRREIEPAGWRFVEEADLIVTKKVAASFPRAAKYEGLPLGWVMSLERISSGA